FKLVIKLKNKGRRPTLADFDIYRHAAIDKVKVVGKKAEVEVFEKGKQDPVQKLLLRLFFLQPVIDQLKVVGKKAEVEVFELDLVYPFQKLLLLLFFLQPLLYQLLHVYKYQNRQE